MQIAGRGSTWQIGICWNREILPDLDSLEHHLQLRRYRGVAIRKLFLTHDPSIQPHIMKNLLLPLLLGCSALLPATLLQAAAPAATTFGDFTAGQTFTFTVTERHTARTKGFHVTKNVGVPNGIPDFKIGDQVKFTIGSNGQLKGPGFNITYRRDEGKVNVYAKYPSATTTKGSGAVVSKSPKNKPVKVAMTFNRLNFSGIIPVTTTVDYVMKK